MLSNIFFGIGIFFVLAYGWGFLSRQEFKTHTNLRIVVFWIMALGFYLVHSVPGFHLTYSFPLGIGLASDMVSGSVKSFNDNKAANLGLSFDDYDYKFIEIFVSGLHFF